MSCFFVYKLNFRLKCRTERAWPKAKARSAAPWKRTSKICRYEKLRSALAFLSWTWYNVDKKNIKLNSIFPTYNYEKSVQYIREVLPAFFFCARASDTSQAPRVFRASRILHPQRRCLRSLLRLHFMHLVCMRNSKCTFDCIS